MKVKTLPELFDDADKIKLLNELLETFDDLGLAVLSKADFEAYLYYLIKKHKKKAFTLGKFDWVRLLKVTPAKLNSMQILSSVKFEKLDDKKAELIEALVRELYKNKIEIFDIDQQRLQVLISDMHVKLFVESYAAENGYAIRYASNPNELIIQYELFLNLLDEIEDHYKSEVDLRSELVSSLQKENQTNELQEALKTKKKFLAFFTQKLAIETDRQAYIAAIKTVGNVALQLIMDYLNKQ